MKNQIFSFSLMSLVLGACTDDEKNTVWSAGGPSAKEGWDIFTGEGYRYGSSIIINANSSINAWFAAPGDFHNGEGDMMYKASGNTMYQLGSSVFAKSFELQQECVSIGIYCPNWSSSTKSMTLTLYKWDTDYTTTLASTPVNSRHFTSYGDNSRLQISADKAADGSTKIPAGENTCGP